MHVARYKNLIGFRELSLKTNTHSANIKSCVHETIHHPEIKLELEKLKSLRPPKT